jgi:hypothetical protein
MKIAENLVNEGKKRVYAKSYRHPFYPNGISDDDLFFSSIFTYRASPPEADKQEAYICFVIKSSQSRF